MYKISANLLIYTTLNALQNGVCLGPQYQEFFLGTPGQKTRVSPKSVQKTRVKPKHFKNLINSVINSDYHSDLIY